MRRRTFITTVLFAGIAVACGREAKLPAIPARKPVLAFGDSVTFGTGAAAGEDWPTLLARSTGWRVTNAGIPGDTAEAGKERLAALLEEHQPVRQHLQYSDFLSNRDTSGSWQ